MSPLWKLKGTPLEIGNYRGITLLNVDGKAYVTLLLHRVRKHLQAGLLDAQHGFMPNRGTADCLFVMRRLVETAREYRAELHAAFVDFKQAFDSVNHAVLWEVLKARGVHPKLVNMISDLYNGSRARVTAHGCTSDWFDLMTGVRQGCPLSPTLFNVFIDFIVRQVIAACAEQGVHCFTMAFCFHNSIVPMGEDANVTVLMLLYEAYVFCFCYMRTTWFC